jgi:hypothetical protein
MMPPIEPPPAPMENPVNNPYPTTAQLRAEAVSGRLLAEQAASTALFRAMVQTALDGINRLDFPLGSPTLEYDVAGVTSHLTDAAGRTVPRRNGRRPRAGGGVMNTLNRFEMATIVGYLNDAHTESVRINPYPSSEAHPHRPRPPARRHAGRRLR